MALVIENGTIVAGANSYVTVAEIKAFASSRGPALTQNDAEIETFAIQAMDYLESYRSQYKGSRVSATQPLQWPRKDVYIDGESFPSDAIPVELKNAQMQGALDVANGFPFSQATSGYAVKREKVDVIEVEYATGSGQSSTAIYPASARHPAVDMWLQPLLRAMGMLSATRA